MIFSPGHSHQGHFDPVLPTFSMTSFLTKLTTLAYVTQSDLLSTEAFRDQKLFALKAPAETTLEVPDADEVIINVS